METAPKPDHPPQQGSFRFKGTLLLISALVVGCLIAARFLRPQADAQQMELPIISSKDASDTTPKANSDNNPAKVAARSSRSLPNRVSQAEIDAAEHPFDPLLVVANECLQKIDEEIFDYTATLTSQVRIDGTLNNPRTLFCKIRHPREEPNKNTFSVYTRFIKPDSVKGQEAIWVDGWHEGNLVAHITGFANLKRFYLPPTSSYAMDGTLHPITEIGFRKLLVKMCEVAKRDRQHGECTVTVTKNLVINGRECTMFEASHPKPRDHFEFHIARIYIDNELEIPLAYEGFLWPEKEGGQPLLLEKYYYSDVKCNVGLTDIDFDPANEEYDYPSF